jgi:nicotinamidase-related amidase
MTTRARAPSRPMRAALLIDFHRGYGRGGALGARFGGSDHAARRTVLERGVQTPAWALPPDDVIVRVRVSPAGRAAGVRTRGRPLAASGALDETRPKCRVVAEAQPAPGELVVVEGPVCPFAEDGLDYLLRARGSTHLLVAGVATASPSNRPPTGWRRGTSRRGAREPQ